MSYMMDEHQYKLTERCAQCGKIESLNAWNSCEKCWEIEMKEIKNRNKYKGMFDVAIDQIRRDKIGNDKESTIYNILIKSITHITTTESVKRDTKAIMEALNA